jgi:transcriptional regulator with XRE-family HTH domain
MGVWTMATFGQRIKQLRKDNKLSQEALAKQFSLNHSTLSKWEKDSSLPDIITAKNIASFFNVTTDFLLGNDDDGFEVLLMKILRQNQNLMSADEKEFLLEMIRIYISAIKNKRSRY